MLALFCFAEKPRGDASESSRRVRRSELEAAVIGQYTLLWFGLMIIGIANGILREATYGKVLSELRAHQLSTVAGMLLIGAVVWVFAQWFPLQTARTALLTGCVWLGLTVAFEFVFGRTVAGHSWSRLLRDYNLRAGRLWVVFLGWILALPYLVYRIG